MWHLKYQDCWVRVEWNKRQNIWWFLQEKTWLSNAAHLIISKATAGTMEEANSNLKICHKFLICQKIQKQFPEA